MDATPSPTPEDFGSFGDLLKFLRKRRKLTQIELALAVGYSESQLSHLEQGHRSPDKPIIAARFVPALGLELGDAWAARLLELASPLRAQASPGLPLPKLLAGLYNLPVHMTSFVGRQIELAQVVNALTNPAIDRAGGRLVTLTGAGGAGKTRLAAQAATLLTDVFPQGIWWVDLGSLSKPSLVPHAAAAVFGLKDQSGRPMTRSLTEFLRAANLLLILDNCEHLITPTATLIDAILRECPRVKLLVTSNQVLNISGEIVFRVPSLATPAPHTLPSLLTMPRYDAVRLFTDRATAVDLTFTLTTENVAPVVQICQRLDGIPLAIELAAARLRMLSIEQIARGLDDRFKLLTGGSRTAPPRHQTLHALVDWSYGLLSEPERILLQQLSVFAGGWTLEGAQALARTQKTTDGKVIELLGQLIDKSLVVMDQRGGAVHYRMLDTIRQYALEKARSNRRLHALQRAHAQYFLGLAESEQTADAWFFPNQALHERLFGEYDNVRAALWWSQSSSADPQFGIELVSVLLRFWFERGYWSEWRSWVEGALVLAPNLPPSPALARAHFGLGTVLAFQSEFAASQEQLEHSLALYQALGDVPWHVYVTFRLGWLARERDDPEMARRLMESSLAQFRELGDQARIAEVMVTLGEVAMMLQDTARAQELLNQGMAIRSTPEGMRANLPWALNHLGHVAQLEGDYDRASSLHAASLHLFGAFGAHHSGVAWAHQGLGESALARRDSVAASGHLAQALAIFRDLGDRMGVAWCLAGFAALSADDNDHVHAALLWGAAEALRRSIGARYAPAVRTAHERLLDSSRAHLGNARFEEWQGQGGGMQLDDAIGRALARVV